MKKLLLIAALAAAALGVHAQGYNLELLWEVNPTELFATTGDVRQGFGMNGKFYINDKSTQTIYIVDRTKVTGMGDANGNGQVGIADVTQLINYLMSGNESDIVWANCDLDFNGKVTIADVTSLISMLMNQNAMPTLSGGPNCAITRDEAGNIILSMAAFPGNAAGSSIKVLNPVTGETKEYEIPEECGFQGRCDFFGFAKGNLMEDGAIYLTGGNTNQDAIYTDGVAVFTVADGEVDTDNCFLAPVNSGIVGQTSTVINYYTDIDGEEALIYAYRSGYPTKLTFDGNMYNKTSLNLPAADGYNKGHCNGAFPFIWDDMELIIYPLLPDYRDGWAIAEAGAESPIVYVTATTASNPNGFQNNWLNAEVDDEGVTIYQYMPGYIIRVYRLTKI